MNQPEQKAQPEQRTNEALMDCARWLQQCLGFGWKHSDLDGLEKIWWQHHDHKGNLTKSLSQPEAGEEKRVWEDLLCDARDNMILGRTNLEVYEMLKSKYTIQKNIP